MGPLSGPELQCGFKYSLALVKILDTPGKSVKKQDPVMKVFSSVQFTQSCPTLCDPMNRSTPGLPVHHQLPEFIQTHVHRVGDANQASYPLSSPSPPALNPSQNENLLQ